MMRDIKLRVNRTQYEFIKKLVESGVDVSISGVVRKIIDVFIILSKTDIFDVLTPMTKEIASVNNGPFDYEIKVTLNDIHIMYIDRISANTGDNRSQSIRKMITLMYIWNNTGFYRFLKPMGDEINALEKAINSNDLKLYY